MCSGDPPDVTSLTGRIGLTHLSFMDPQMDGLGAAGLGDNPACWVSWKVRYVWSSCMEITVWNWLNK